MTFETQIQAMNTIVVRTFGSTVTVDGVVVPGDFLEPYEEVYLQGQSAAGTAPQIILETANVPASPVGKAVIAKTRNFTVREARPDGHGLTILLLTEVH
jgi:hypothetical protein